MPIMSYERGYTTARGVASILEVFGWIVVVVGLLGALIGFFTGGFFSSSMGSGGFFLRLFAMIPGLFVALNGVVAIAFVQHLRANVDTAEMTREMLQIARRQEFAAFGDNAIDAARSAVTGDAEVGSQETTGSVQDSYGSPNHQLKAGDNVFHQSHGAGIIIAQHGPYRSVVEFSNRSQNDPGRTLSVDSRDLSIKAESKEEKK